MQAGAGAARAASGQQQQRRRLRHRPVPQLRGASCIKGSKLPAELATVPTMPFTLVIHGGAGGGGNEDGKVVEVDASRSKLLADALHAGAAILAAGGTALDAAEAAVRSMEDCPAFNAGRGSVFTSTGEHEMDASIMDGATMACGAVAGLRSTRNPIRAARYVMEKTPRKQPAATVLFAR